MISINKIVSLLLVLGCTFHHHHQVDAAKILGFFATPSRSHFIIQEPLMKGLAAKGHEVTVISLYEPSKNLPSNYKHIQINLEKESAEVERVKSGFIQAAANKENFLLNFVKIFKTLNSIPLAALKHPELEKLKSEQQFDLVVFGWFLNDYQIGVAAHFKCPSVFIVTFPALKILQDYVGNPTGVSHTPSSLLGSKDHMSFLQRVANFGAAIVEYVFTKAFDYFVLEQYYSEFFPSAKYPSYWEAKKNVSLVLAAQHFSQTGPIATFPGLVEISGIHIDAQPNPLPEDIKQWLDNATDGAIFFSLGSNVNSSDLAPEKRNAILRSFAKLKQKVLWKWEDEFLPGKPDNVKIGKWLPQNDILAHPNIRLFISHCGKGSITESKYHGVPILALPLFSEQGVNAKQIVDEGWAVKLSYDSLTEDSFDKALREILTNTTYRKVIKEAAVLFKDRPMSALDSAVYWVEYVIRHNGAKHMQSQAVHLNFFQYYSLDVIGFILACLYIVFKIFIWSVKYVFRKCCARSVTKMKLN